MPIQFVRARRGPPFVALCFMIWALLAGTPQSALAQPSTEPPAYRPLIDEALREYAEHNFTEARALFLKAIAVYPSARAYRGVGMSEFELRNYGDSAGNLEQALNSTVQPLTGSLRTETERLLERARNFLARVNLALEPGMATVIVDGVPVQLGPQGVLVLEIGPHTLEFHAEGHTPEKRVLKVKGGEEQSLRIVLPARDAPAPAQVYAPPAPVMAEPAVAAAPEEAAPSRGRFFFVPRLTIVFPGKAKETVACEGDGCDEAENHFKPGRNTGVLLGAEFLFAATPEFYLGLGFHAQLNSSTYDYPDGTDSFAAGRALWLPAIAEYRVAVSKSIDLPIRASAGLALLVGGKDLEDLADSLRENCQDVVDDGGKCSVDGPPGVGVILGAGPGVVVHLGPVGLRADLALGYQWLRLLKSDISLGSSHATLKNTLGAFTATASFAVEI